MDTTLAIEGLTFAYPKASPSLKNICLNIKSGELVGLLGPNGAGKSTLLRALVGPEALGGTCPPGRIEFNGKCLDKEHRERAKVVAYLPQTLPPNVSLEVEEVVRLGRFPHKGFFGGRNPLEKRIIESAMADCGILEMRRRSIQTLSGGERQRVFLASALAQQSPVLLLDEPTSALDLEHSLRLTTILEALASEGQHAIVLATHDINLAARCCTRLVVLKQGEVVADGPPIDVLSESLMRSVFGVETAIEISQTTSTPYILPLRAAERR